MQADRFSASSLLSAVRASVREDVVAALALDSTAVLVAVRPPGEADPFEVLLLDLGLDPEAGEDPILARGRVDVRELLLELGLSDDVDEDLDEIEERAEEALPPRLEPFGSEEVEAAGDAEDLQPALVLLADVLAADPSVLRGVEPLLVRAVRASGLSASDPEGYGRAYASLAEGLERLARTLGLFDLERTLREARP